MPVPGNWTAVTLVNEYQLAGVPLKGYVTFTPTARVVNTASGVIQPPGGRVVHLDADGKISVELPVVDDPDVSPTGWAWRVTEELVLPTGRPYTHTYDIQVTAEMVSPVKLADLAEVTPVGEVSPYLRRMDIGTTVAAQDDSRLVGATRRGTETGLGAVVLTMDDAFIAMDTVRQLLDARGQRGTFCITPGLMGGAGKITNAHILAMVAGGHEVAAHSQTHANFTGLTPAQRKTELQQPKDYLEALIGRPVTTFAYPFGTASGGRNATTDTEVYPLYERVLDTSLNTQMAMHPRSAAPPSLIRRTTWDDTNQAQILAMVRQAAVTPVIASIFFHDLGTSVNPTTANLIEMLDLCASLGVPLVTVSEAFGGFRMLGNPSFEDSATDVYPWRKFTSGAGAADVVTVTPDAGLSGTRAVRLSVATFSTFAYVRQTHPVVPGRTYTLSFRAKVASGTIGQANDAFGRITGVDAGQTALADTVTTGAPTLTTWAKFSVDYVAPQTAAYVNVDLVVNDVAVAAAVDFDHVWFGPKYLGDWG